MWRENDKQEGNVKGGGGKEEGSAIVWDARLTAPTLLLNSISVSQEGSRASRANMATPIFGPFERVTFDELQRIAELKKV